MPEAEIYPYPVRTRWTDPALWRSDLGAASRLGAEYVKYLVIRGREALIGLGSSARRRAQTRARMKLMRSIIFVIWFYGYDGRVWASRYVAVRAAGRSQSSGARCAHGARCDALGPALDRRRARDVRRPANTCRRAPR